MFWKKKKRPPPVDGRIEKQESVDKKKSVAEYVTTTLGEINRRYHDEPVPIDHRAVSGG